MSTRLSQLDSLLKPAIEAMGFELWGIEFHPAGQKSVLRIFIDSPQGVGVDDCARVSHQVSGIMDVEDPIAEQYLLEVSSPGADRTFFKLEQYADFAGHVLDVKLRVPYEGRRRFKGILNGVEGDEILLVIDSEEYLLPYELIEKAKLVPVYQ